MADIGDKLRSAREAKGLSIADIEKATKIQSRYLEAIEQNDFDKLPGDFYVRAFIRQYAQIVGLDGKELLSEYHKDVPESKPDEYVENSIDNKTEEVRETTDNKKNLWKNYLPRIGVGLAVIVVILVVYVLYARLSSNSQNNNNASDNVTVSSQSSSSKKTKTTTPKVKKSSVKITKVGTNDYRITGLKNNRKLVIKAGDQAISASVSVNNVVRFQQTLQANEKHSLTLPTDATNVVITFGSDTGTSVRVAGKKVPYQATGTYLSLTLLIGKQNSNNSTSNNSTSSSTQSRTTTQNNGTTSSNQSSTNNYNNTQGQTRQSSRTQSSTTQSSQTRNSQSSATQQSSTTTTDNTNDTGGNGDNGQ